MTRASVGPARSFRARSSSESMVAAWVTSASTAKSPTLQPGASPRGRRYEIMSANERALERCVQRLIAQGRRYGGYVTYRMVRDTLHGTQPEVCMEALDFIYERLVAEGIEIVDQLPDRAAIAVGPDTDEGDKEGSYEYQPRAETARWKRRYKYVYDTSETPSMPEPSLCPEEAIDELLFRAEAGLLYGKVFWNIVKKCQLSKLEVRQLVEYLWSKGIDIPDLDVSRIYDSLFTNDRETDAGREEGFLDDPVIKHYCKKSNGWEH